MSRRAPLIAFVVGALLVLGLWYLLLWRPVAADLDVERDRRSAADAELRSLAVRQAQLEAVSNDIPALQSRLRDLAAAVPDTPNLADLILATAEAERDSGIAFLAVNTGDPQAGPQGLTEIPVVIDAAGGYFQMLDFINRLNSMARILTIDELDLRATSEENEFGPPELDVTVTGRVFTTASVEDIPLAERPAVPEPADTTTTTTSTTTTTEPAAAAGSAGVGS